MTERVATDPTFPTEAEFLAWRSKNPNRGRPNLGGECPLAECLKDRGFLYPNVGESRWLGTIFGKNRRELVSAPTPEWASQWIGRYDGQAA